MKNWKLHVGIAAFLVAVVVAGSLGVIMTNVVLSIRNTLVEDHKKTEVMWNYLNRQAQPQAPTITPVPDPPKKEK